MPEVEGVEHRFVDADGVRLHVAEAGEGDPLLLVHGWPQHWYMWGELIGPLAERYRVLCPDLRGFGWSDCPGDGYEPDTFASDQIALLDALDIERASVIGHDWGGFVAFLLSMRHPERLGRAVALNDPHPWPRLRPTIALAAWRSWYAMVAAGPGRRPRVHRWLARQVLGHGNVGEPFTSEEIESFAEQFSEPARARAGSSLYRAYFRLLARGVRGGWRAERLRVPTLLVFGTKDVLITTGLVEGDPPPGLRIDLVPDAGHFVVNERPELVLERATAFLAEA
jgi:pimeloyl-ACP methyl ester carboxylesterase